jgi:hypothetical protein
LTVIEDVYYVIVAESVASKVVNTTCESSDSSVINDWVVVNRVDVLIVEGVE